MNKRVTLVDVARAAGVHHTTVSLALRNHPRLPKETADRLKALAAQMGYRPDPVLASLVAYRNGIAVQKNTQCLAYLLRLNNRRDLQSDPSAGYWAGALEQADLLGYRLEKFWLDEDGVKPHELRRILHARGIRGVLIVSVPPGSAHLDLDWDHFCTVRIGHHPAKLLVPAVANNLLQITRVAVEKIHALGFRRIGLVTSYGDTLKLADLIRGGFELGCNACMLSERVHPLLITDDRGPQGRARMIARVRNWVRRSRVDALLSNWNFPAEELREIGASAFFSLDATSIKPGLPPLQGMVQNHRLVGMRALDQLALLLKTNQFGLQTFPSLSLIEGYWRDEAGAARPMGKTNTRDALDAPQIGLDRSSS